MSMKYTSCRRKYFSAIMISFNARSSAGRNARQQQGAADIPPPPDAPPLKKSLLPRQHGNGRGTCLENFSRARVELDFFANKTHTNANNKGSIEKPSSRPGAAPTRQAAPRAASATSRTAPTYHQSNQNQRKAQSTRINAGQSGPRQPQRGGANKTFCFHLISENTRLQSFLPPKKYRGGAGLSYTPQNGSTAFSYRQANDYFMTSL